MPIAKVNGISLNYEVQGSGEPLVMIAGYSAELTSWRYQAPDFKKHFQLITFDNRGSGKSGKPPGPYSITVMAADTLKLMDYLNIRRAHILGLSLGGMIAQELAIRYPDRVMKLILGSTWAHQDDESSGATPQLLAIWDLPVRKYTSHMLGLCFNSIKNRLFIVPLMQFKCGRLGEAEAIGFQGQKDSGESFDTLNKLPSIVSPTLVMAGTNDRVIKPASSDLIAQKIPNARLVKIRNGSHTFNWEMKDAFNREVLSFLQSA